MRRWLATKFTEMCLKNKEEIQVQPWISYKTDVWTSPNMAPFISITTHWIDEEWNKKEVLIFLKKFEASTLVRLVSITLNYGNRSTNLFLTGENLAKAFVEVLESYDILHAFYYYQ